MTNLLQETILTLKDNNKTTTNILWVGSVDFGYFSWQEFAEIAKNTNYDSGYGGQEVASDLLIVGKDFWLERYEYDGSECWEFKQIPKKSKRYIKIKDLASNNYSWNSLEDLNN